MNEYYSSFKYDSGNLQLKMIYAPREADEVSCHIEY